MRFLLLLTAIVTPLLVQAQDDNNVDTRPKIPSECMPLSMPYEVAAFWECEDWCNRHMGEYASTETVHFTCKELVSYRPLMQSVERLTVTTSDDSLAQGNTDSLKHEFELIAGTLDSNANTKLPTKLSGLPSPNAAQELITYKERYESMMRYQLARELPTQYRTPSDTSGTGNVASSKNGDFDPLFTVQEISDFRSLIRTNISGSATEQASTCKLIQTGYINASTAVDEDISIVANKQINNDFNAITHDTLMQFRHGAHYWNAIFEVLYNTTLPACERSRPPVVSNGGGVLPGIFSSGAANIDRTDRGIDYFTNRFLPGATNFFLTFAYIAAIVGLVIGGMMYVASAFDTELRERAKKTITWSILGVIIATMAYAIVRFIVGLDFFDL